MQTSVIRIGTRGSALALAQAVETRSPADGRARPAGRGLRHRGDFDQRRPHPEPAAVGSRRQGPVHQGDRGGAARRPHRSRRAFVEGHADELPDGLEISAFLPREDARDAFIGRTAKRIVDLPQGATVGSSSLRRQALLLRMRPDLKVVLFRGNVQTRLQKARRGRGRRHAARLCRAEAAVAGRRRHRPDAARRISAGARPGRDLHRDAHRRRARSARFVAPLHDAVTAAALDCERAFLAALDGSCRTPIAGYAHDRRRPPAISPA